MFAIELWDPLSTPEVPLGLPTSGKFPDSIRGVQSNGKTKPRPTTSASSPSASEPTESRSSLDHAVATRASSERPQVLDRARAPLHDLGLTGTSHLVLGPELLAPRTIDKREKAEAELNQRLAREVLEGDELVFTSLTAGVRRRLLEAVQASFFETHNRVVLALTLSDDGKVQDAEILSGSASVASMTQKLLSVLEAGSTGLLPSRPIRYVFELTQSTRLPSGRTAGTGVSLGGLPLKRAAAEDSPKVELVPPKWRFERARKLSRSRDEMEQDPSRDIYVEQRLFDTNLDPIEVAARTRRETQAKLLSHSVL